ncbi:MAG TPA: S-methyl-5-thioribose-1-phosphate isomerase, partial [Gammaproteobacteria bacterium]
MSKIHDTIRAITWGGNSLFLLDQRILPKQKTEIELQTAQEVATAIRDMVVRGAPAIGITAAYGVVLAARQRFKEDPQQWKQNIQKDLKILADSRPTAVNLFWALDRMQNCINNIQGDPVDVLKQEADAIYEEDIQANYTMGKLGASLIASDGKALLTHCNTGSLATGGFG